MKKLNVRRVYAMVPVMREDYNYTAQCALVYCPFNRRFIRGF